MKLKINNPFFHILYWVFVTVFLILIFGRSWGNKKAAFYFVSCLLPVVLGTSYFFNYYLVPEFLLKKAYFRFGLYFFYTIVISLFLEMVVLTFTFVFLLDFEFGRMNPNASDTLLLAVVMYLVVFTGSFLLMAKQLSVSYAELRKLEEDQNKMKKSILHIVSQRKSVRIPLEDILYIESLSDYIIIHTCKKEPIKSKEKISAVEKKLPGTFLRIHRSFIVNTDKIIRFDYDEVEMDGFILNIGRSYKKEVLRRLKSGK